MLRLQVQMLCIIWERQGFFLVCDKVDKSRRILAFVCDVDATSTFGDVVMINHLCLTEPNQVFRTLWFNCVKLQHNAPSSDDKRTSLPSVS